MQEGEAVFQEGERSRIEEVGQVYRGSVEDCGQHTGHRATTFSAVSGGH